MLSLKIKEIRSILNFTQHDLANFLNVTTGAVGNWENNSRNPDIDTLKKLSQATNLSLDYILNNEIDKLSLNKSEENLILMYRELNAEGQEKLTEYADDLLCSEKYIKNTTGSMAN